ncbi:ATP-dependent nuclease [Cohnella sp. 56]|uniref:ATP-dependent nuclease n=1 Tax=Cohnella sp. 56 TaxID=3113722 RepID=UPI0030E877E2
MKKVDIKHYRNFDNAVVEFQDGINIIIGPNNAGKSNLLRVINLLDNINENDGSIHDFNKNDLHENLAKYLKEPPCIEIVYHIEHALNMNGFDDGILRFKNFIVYTADGNLVQSGNGSYIIDAVIMLKYELDAKYINDYVDIVKNSKGTKEFLLSLEKLLPRYSWNYYNTTSQTPIKKSEVRNIFNIDYIPADRKTEELLPHTQKYVRKKLDEFTGKVELRSDITQLLVTNFSSITEQMKQLIEFDQGSIGIKNGNNTLIPSFIYNSEFDRYFQYVLEDSSYGYEMPMKNNGLGYNNLVQIYNIITFKINNDYNLLLIEEPEAHLHPAMQYKLFKYLSKLKQADELSKKRETENLGEVSAENTNVGRVIKNQIFVTTHSSNITAAANLDDMISLKYYRDPIKKEHKVVSENLKNKYSNVKFKESKTHLTKFLDVTRSDMMFAYKVILVEGLAEKLLMSAFAQKCDIDFDIEDNHISVVEVGGINFKHFLPLFVGTNTRVLCFRDCDYKYFDESELKYLSEYREHLNSMKLLGDDFQQCTNIMVRTQSNLGSTFENELFIENFENKSTVKRLLEMVTPETLHPFIEAIDVSLTEWQNNLTSISNAKTKKKVAELLEPYYEKYTSTNDAEYQTDIEKICFANLFLSYAENKKGDLALNILSANISSDPDKEHYLIDDLIVPTYIKEGLEWLKLK